MKTILERNNKNIQESWKSALSYLRLNVRPSSAYDTFIAPLSPVYFDEKNKIYYLETNAPFIKSIIEERYIPLISTSLSFFYDKTISPSIILSNEAEDIISTFAPKEEDTKSFYPATQKTPLLSNTILPNYTFNNFIVDDQNRFAHAIAVAVSKKPGVSDYNPLFLYGSSGLGKTHLLHAIGNAFLKNFPKKKVLYISSEEFTSDFIYATKNNDFIPFKKKYRTVDLLLLDDIQFIDSTKEKTSEEIFHTYNALYNLKKQLVFSSDRAPSEILGIKKRLSSRLSSGILTDISPPAIETRIAILENQLTEKHMEKTKEFSEVIEFIASRIQNNIRDLIGAFNRIIAFSTLSGTSLSLSAAKTVLKDLLTEETPVNIDQIISSVCIYFNISKTDIISKKREAKIAFARQIAMFLIRTHTSSSYKKIGFLFGGRDHTTVMHSCEKISKNIHTKKINSSLTSIENSLF
ncbi:MAG: chromosomal replication initiator protein DnaA [Clostridiales Family XIII bacterium]|jgi:chromosomal replication initiator protein|nr:chromosomal replication initiator protein DnaA [Clostridiales Family XIII bacterium]